MAPVSDLLATRLANALPGTVFVHGSDVAAAERAVAKGTGLVDVVAATGVLGAR